MSLLAVFAVGAVASASASAAPEWNVCEEGTGAGTKFTEHKCTTVSGTGKWEWKTLVGTKKVKSKNKAGVSFVFKGEAGGVMVKMTCTVKDTGTINQVAGSAGTDEETIEFENCVVEKPGPGLCVVTDPVTKTPGKVVVSGVETELLAGTPVKDVNKPPKHGTVFVTLEFLNKSPETCPLNGMSFPVTGTDTGLFSGNVLQYTAASSNLKFGGHPATLEGEAELELENGWAVTAK
ncbi:MAG TPA: hypothetical protein VII53_01945 [Solirubrobacteraceae bacterium]